MTNLKVNKKKAVTFLVTVIEGVEKILKNRPGGFNINQIVSDYTVSKKGTHCGTVCCIEGWLPEIFPKKYIWEYSSRSVLVHINNDKRSLFYPQEAGIPISDQLWRMLTVPSRSKDSLLPIDASFEEVKKVWLSIIQEIETTNEFDHFITL